MDGYVLGPAALEQIRQIFRELYGQVTPAFMLGVSEAAETRKPMIIGKTDAAHFKGTTGTISVYKGSSSGGYTLTDTGIDITAYNRFGSIASGKWVAVQRFVHGWEVTAAEC